MVVSTTPAAAFFAVIAALCCHCSDEGADGAGPIEPPRSQDAASASQLEASSPEVHDAASLVATPVDAADAASADGGRLSDAGSGLAPLPPSPAVASKVQMIGSAGYSHLGNIVLLAADQIKNAGATTSAALRLELWLTTAPYASATTGYKPAEYDLGTLAPGASLMSVSSGAMPWISPPHGAYHVAIVLTEYTGAATNDGYSHAVHFVFTDLYNES